MIIGVELSKMNVELSEQMLIDFLAGLFVHLNKSLADIDETEKKRQVLHEAMQYLHGAHALFATLVSGRRIEKAQECGQDVRCRLLNSMFDDTYEYMLEVEDELDKVSSYLH